MSPTDEEGRPRPGGEGGLEERVRKVQYLDPFHLSVRTDGRFTCQLDVPVEELKPEEARDAAEALEALARRLRRRIGE